MKKIAVILSRFPYPLEKGDKLRAYYQLKELSKKYEVHLFCLTNEAPSEKLLAKLSFCQSIEYFVLNKWGQRFSLLKNFFFKTPFQVAYFYNRKAKKKWDNFIERNQVDYLYHQLLRTAEYGKDKIKYTKTLDYQDVLSVGMERMAGKQKWPMKWLYKSEAKRLKRYEYRMFNYFEHHTIISEQDKKLIPHPLRDEIIVVPNGISEKFLKPSIQLEKKYDLCFVGNLSYPPNIESCRFIFNEIVKEMPKLKVLFSGANPVKEIQEMKAPNLELRPWVEDIRVSYLESKILVAPMFISTGMQNKILESMALGVPCITTPMANNAVAANDGSEILLVTKANEFRDKINYLLLNPSVYQEMSENARKWVEERYKWDKTTEILMESCFHDNTEEK